MVERKQGLGLGPAGDVAVGIHVGRGGHPSHLPSCWQPQLRSAECLFSPDRPEPSWVQPCLLGVRPTRSPCQGWGNRVTGGHVTRSELDLSHVF